MRPADGFSAPLGEPPEQVKQDLPMTEVAAVEEDKKEAK